MTFSKNLHQMDRGIAVNNQLDMLSMIVDISIFLVCILGLILTNALFYQVSDRFTWNATLLVTNLLTDLNRYSYLTL